MELERKLRDEFPYLSSLLSEHPLKTANGFSQEVDPLSSKGLLFQNLDHDFDLPINGDDGSSSIFKNSYNLDHFSIEGSSKNPFLENSGTCIDPLGFSLISSTNYYDLNSFISSALLPLQGRVPFCEDYSQKIEDQNQNSLNCQEIGSVMGPNYNQVADDQVSCTTADNNNNNNNNNKNKNKNNGFNKKVDNHNKKDKKFLHHQIKKGGKSHKKSHLIKGQWTPQEDRVLVQLVKEYGIKKWSQIAKMLQGRVGKQCRERWYNHLRPDIKKDAWSEEEDEILIEAHKEIGNKWAEIAKRLPGRTENTIKNHWNATKRRQFSRRNKVKDLNSKPSLLHNYIKTLTSSSSNTQTNHHNKENSISSAMANYNYDHVSLSNDHNNYGFVPLLDEMGCASVVDESQIMEYEMSLELDRLMKGSQDQVMKEMDLLEMITQRSHY